MLKCYCAHFMSTIALHHAVVKSTMAKAAGRRVTGSTSTTLVVPGIPRESTCRGHGTVPDPPTCLDSGPTGAKIGRYPVKKPDRTPRAGIVRKIAVLVLFLASLLSLDLKKLASQVHGHLAHVQDNKTAAGLVEYLHEVLRVVKCTGE